MQTFTDKVCSARLTAAYRNSGDTINKYTYRDSGVDIEAGADLVERIKPHAKSTCRPGAASDLGGFGAIFDMAAVGYKDPLLIAATDGVGTKLRIAIEAKTHETVGIDLVAMCVNDLVVQGAEPLFFLDYFATGKLDIEEAENVVKGIAEGCKQAGCALIGGETAEMPGMYKGGDYDLAGFAVGAVERDRLLTGRGIRAGDIVLGLASNGFHSNGFTLVRNLVSGLNLDWRDPAPFSPKYTLAEALLTPTRIYVQSCREALQSGGVNGLAHITGGGLLENIPRVLPSGLGAYLQAETWPLPDSLRWAANAGNIPADEMARTFNCGVGMVAFVPKNSASDICKIFKAAGETVFEIGHVEETDGSADPVVIEGARDAWAN